MPVQRRTGPRGQQTVNSTLAGSSQASDGTHGHLALSPLKLLIMLGVSGIFFAGASIFQITGTEQATFSNLLSSIQVTPFMVLQQCHDFLSGKLDFYNGVAFAVGFGVNFTLLIATFPATAAYVVLHRHYNPTPDAAMSEGAAKIKHWQDIAMRAIIGADLLTDLLYITQHPNFVSKGYQVFSFIIWFIPWPNFDGPRAGIFVIGVLYALLLCFVSVVSIKIFVANLEVLLLKILGKA